MPGGPLPSRTVADQRVAVTVVNTVAETDVVTLAIPTTVSSGDLIIVRAWGDLLNDTGASVNYTKKIKIGATTVITGAAVGHTNSASRRNWYHEASILITATNAQLVTASVWATTAGANLAETSSGNTMGRANGSAAEDLTSAKNYLLTITMGTASASADFILRGSVMEIIKR